MPAVASYVAVADILPYAYQYNAADQSIFDQLRLRASRIFDKLCLVPAGFFLPSPAQLSDKVIYGRDLPFLEIPQHFGPTPTVSMPPQWQVPSFVEVNGVLNTVDPYGMIQVLGGKDFYPIVWPERVPITVTAQWGWEATPDDVIEAVIELVIAVWRSKDQAFLKAINLETMKVVAESIPERVRFIANRYQAAPWFV